MKASFFKQDDPLLQINCACCFQIFTVCRSCFRRQRYCSKLCSQKAKKLNNRQSNNRYRKTRKGQFNQANRQKTYRNKKKVTDHTSSNPVPNVKAELNCSTEEISTEQILNIPKREGQKKDDLSFHSKTESAPILKVNELCCIFCGRPAIYVIPLVKYSARTRGPPKRSFLI